MYIKLDLTSLADNKEIETLIFKNTDKDQNQDGSMVIRFSRDNYYEALKLTPEQVEYLRNFLNQK